MSQDVTARISRLLDKLMLAESEREIALIQQKIAVLQSMAQQS